jgi:hypothetical protein
LSEKGDSQSFGFEDSCEEGGGETGMIDVSITGNEDDIDGVPAAFEHFSVSERQRLGHGVHYNILL